MCVITSTSGKRTEFQTLNGLRGIAAILVVILHNPGAFTLRPTHAYLAVDCFFVISGFVLSYVYGSRIDNGWALTSFLKARAIRLAPLYILALAFSAFVMSLDRNSAIRSLGLSADLIYFGFGVFLLPSHLRIDPHQDPFPYNNVAWTLFLEVVANVLHCTILRRVRFAGLLWANGLSAVALIACYLHYHNLNAGWQFGQLLTLGLARVSFSYTAGMLAYRLYRKRVLAFAVPSWLLALVTGVLLIVPLGHGAATALILVLFFFPFLVLLSAYNEPGKKLGRIFKILGAASYAVYLLHGPSFELAHIALPGWTLRAPNVGYVFVIVLVAISLLLEQWYDEPVRDWLKEHISNVKAKVVRRRWLLS